MFAPRAIPFQTHSTTAVFFIKYWQYQHVCIQRLFSISCGWCILRIRCHGLEKKISSICSDPSHKINAFRKLSWDEMQPAMMLACGCIVFCSELIFQWFRFAAHMFVAVTVVHRRGYSCPDMPESAGEIDRSPSLRAPIGREPLKQRLRK